MGYYMANKDVNAKVTTPKSGRVFNIVQYEVNPITKQSLNFNEQNIINGVNHQSITRYGYIRHDKDHYSESDIERMADEYGITVTLNDVKPPHWHIVLEAPNKLTVKTIAKWFNIPENQIEVPNNRGKTLVTTRGMEKVFIECIGYLTHSDIRQQTQDKHEYDDSEVKSNFDWKEAVVSATILRTKYGKELSEKEWLRNEVLTNGLKPRDMMRNPLMVTAYTNDSQMLDKLRAKYLREFAPMPSTRYNFYICSDKGREGKGLLSRALARSLYPNIDNDDDIFFTVGGKNVSFDGYDGQPVIIWNDIRPFDLINIFGDRGNMLDTLDIHPVRKDENIKFGKVCLVNTINIFNSVIPYWEFFDGLAGEYTDKYGNMIRSEMGQKEQVCGRFPFVIPVSKEDFGIMLNKGIMQRGAFTEYYEHKRVVSHMVKIHQTLSDREELVRKLDAEAVAPIVDSVNLVDSFNKTLGEFDNMSDEEVLQYFADCGSDVTDAQLIKQYEEWVNEWCFNNERLRVTSGCPTYEWWLTHVKQMQRKG